MVATLVRIRQTAATAAATSGAVVRCRRHRHRRRRRRRRSACNSRHFHSHLALPLLAARQQIRRRLNAYDNRERRRVDLLARLVALGAQRLV